jgi:S1-C subfamily serine protease
MKRLLYLLCFFFFITACMPSYGLATDNSRAVSNAIESSVSIQVPDGWFGWTTIGSGTVVRKHNSLYMGPEPKFAILTAQHVADYSQYTTGMRACSDVNPYSCVSLTSYTHGDNSSEKVTGKDWALVFVKSLPVPMKPARVRSKPLVLGERVVILGHPWQDFLVSEGICGSKGTREGPMDRITSYAAPGSSGGGVFDRRGRMVGIVSGIAVHQGHDGELEFQYAIVYTVPVGNVVW